MGISNCASCGADSYVAPITGVVSRRDKLTQEEVPASVRPNGVPTHDKNPIVNGVSLAAETLAAALGVGAS